MEYVAETGAEHMGAAAKKHLIRDIAAWIDALASLEGRSSFFATARRLLEDFRSVVPTKKLKEMQTKVHRAELEATRERHRHSRRLEEEGWSGEDIPEDIIESILGAAVFDDPALVHSCAAVSTTWRRVARRLAGRLVARGAPAPAVGVAQGDPAARSDAERRMELVYRRTAYRRLKGRSEDDLRRLLVRKADHAIHGIVYRRTLEDTSDSDSDFFRSGSEDSSDGSDGTVGSV